MTEIKLPKESESQEIGQHAVLALRATYPINWRPTETEGDSDVGLDMQVQIVKQYRYRGLFHVQVKGSRQKENGRNKKLSKDSKYYSETLNIATLNYYTKVESPVMLVFADLTQDADPRKCKVYYLWLDADLDVLLAGNESLDHLKKDSHTFKIPVENELTNDVDILPYLASRLDKKRASEGILKAVQKHRPQDVPKTMHQLGHKLSSKVTFESVLNTTDNPWLDAPKGSLAHELKTTAGHLEMNNADLTELELEKLKVRLKKASLHEVAEYNYQMGLTCALKGKDSEALTFHKEAHEVMPAINKYHLAFLEQQLHINYLDNNFCKKLSREIEKRKDEIEYCKLLAKLFAITGEMDKAEKCIASFDEEEVVIIKTLLLLIKRDFKTCVEYCNEWLEKKDLKLRRQLSLHLFKARAHFNLGLGPHYSESGDTIIPFSGYPNMDVVNLKHSWDELKRTWTLAEKLGYPRDVDYILDISSILSSYFDDFENTYNHLKYLSKLRPFDNHVQSALLFFAQKLADKKTIREQLDKLPETPENIVNKVLLNYYEDNKSNVVDLSQKNLPILIKEKPPNLDNVLAIAALCANELVKTKKRDEFLASLKALPGSEMKIAVYEFVAECNERPLNKQNALNKLYSLFEEGADDQQLLTQLFEHLSANEVDSANQLFSVYNAISLKRDFEEAEILKICNAFATLEKFDELLVVLKKAIERFGEKPRLIALKAMALDELGDTPASLDLLETVVDNDVFDPYAFELYAQISARCGFASKAQKLLTKLYEKTTDNKRKLHLLRMMFLMEQYSNPESQYLLDYCEKYGKINDSSNEAEEGIYLQLFFGATMSGKIIVSDEQKKCFNERLKAYGKNFPDSKHLRSFSIDENSSGAEILEQLSQVTGMTDSLRNWYEKNETLLKRGQAPIPFCIRHKFLLNVTDPLYLWQLAKNLGNNFNQYQLTISAGVYELREIKQYIHRVPLLDETALFVLYDLGLLDSLFSIFDNIAITKSTISRLHGWGQSSLISPLSDRAKAIASSLTEHVSKIQQPSCKGMNFLDIDYEELERYQELIKRGYIFYTDDAFTRILVCGDNHIDETITTLDIINCFRQKRILSEKESAEKIAQLCLWNVNGVPVNYMDILIVVTDDLSEPATYKNIRSVLEVLAKNKYFDAYVDGIWVFNKPYKLVLEEIASFLAMMISKEDGFEIDNNVIGAIWYKWSQNIRYSQKGEKDVLSYFARSFCVTSNLLLSIINNKDQECKSSQRLWSVYKDLVSFEYADRMNQSIYDLGFTLVAQFAAEAPEQFRNKLFNFITSGLTTGTSDSVLFNQAYSTARIKKAVKK